jgi:hypothetical protein
MHRFSLFFLPMFLLFSAPAQAASVQSVSVFGGLVGGYNVRTEATPWSIMVGGGFEYGTKRIALYADIHSIPFMVSRLGPDGVYRPSFILGTLGLTMGNKIVRVGPFVSAGYVGSAIGARLVLAPKGGPNTGWHGMEYRVGYYAPDVVMGAILYTWRWTRFGPKVR